MVQPNGYLDLTAQIYHEDGQWVSECPELDLASCGDTVEQAFAALWDAVTVYLATLDDLGELEHVLRERGVPVARDDSANATRHVTVEARPDEFVSPHRVPLPPATAEVR